ncbi:helix-turn-helix domain-containing protein [Halobacteriales archaeon Cl-PHB]
MTEFATDVELRDIAVRDTAVSDAVDEPVRAMILDALTDEALSVAQMHDRLADRGYDRTENTVRHHVNELREAGLVDVARLEERRGGTTKFYRANTIVLSYTLPDSAEDRVDAMAESVRPAMAEMVADLHENHADTLDDIAGEMAPCEHCNTQKYETFLLLTALRRAFVDTLSD